MTNLQLWLAIGVPCFTILTSLIVSLVQIFSIKQDMRDLRADVKSDNKDLRADIRADMQEIKADIKLLTGKVYEIMGQRP